MILTKQKRAKRARQTTRVWWQLQCAFDGTKPRIIFGHDESIFKQYTHSKRGWVWPDGK